MTSQSRSVERTARRAIVFGGGGVLGGTWAVGALSAWEQATGLRAKDVDISWEPVLGRCLLRWLPAVSALTS